MKKGPEGPWGEVARRSGAGAACTGGRAVPAQDRQTRIGEWIRIENDQEVGATRKRKGRVIAIRIRQVFGGVVEPETTVEVRIDFS